jgi:hypothetical protein
MNIPIVACALVAALACTACNSDPVLGQTSWECPVASTEPLTETEHAAVARDAQGRMVRFELTSGEILAGREPSGRIEQLAFDPFALRAVAVEAAPHGSAIVAYGAGQTLAWTGAGARVLPSSFGLVVFEPAGAWWLLRGGLLTPGRSAAFPIGAWLAGSSVHAISPTADGTIGWLVAAIDEHGLGEPRLQTELAAEGAARAAPARDGAVIAGCSAGVATLRLIDADGELRSETSLGNAAIVADVVSLGAASRSERVAVLLGDPPVLAVVELTGRLATLELPGRLPGGLLLDSDDRLLAATSHGIFAVIVGPDLTLERDASFDGGALRAPLAGPLDRRRSP